MPYKPARPCKYPGCIHAATVATGYCEAHAHFYASPQNPENFQRPADARPSAAARGYGSRWQRVRAEVLKNAGIPPALPDSA